MSYVGTKPGATVPPAAGMVKSDGVVLQTAVPNTDYLPAANPTFTGDLTAGGVGQRIKGDFSNATVANRAMFQTSVVNGPTSVAVAPNGSSNSASLWTHSAADPTNASIMGMYTDGNSGYLYSGKYGTGAYIPMVFYTGGLERMRIATDGTLGLGASPQATARLTVEGQGISGGQSAVFRAFDGGANPYLLMSHTAAAGTRLGASSSAGGVSARLILASGGQDAMLMQGTTIYIGNSGGLGVSSRIQMAYTGGGSEYGITLRPAVDGTVPINFQTSAGVQVGYITQDTVQTQYLSTSDHRLKEDVQPLSGAMDRISQLKPRTFTWKTTGTKADGFIAHELQAVIPQAVWGQKDEVDAEGNPKYQGVDSSFIIPHLVAALQELKAEFDAYKASHP